MLFMYCFGVWRSCTFSPREPLALALTHLLALDRDGLEPAVELVARQQRHRQRDDGRHRGDRREDARDELRVVQPLDQVLDHDAVLLLRMALIRKPVSAFRAMRQKSKLIIFFITKMPIDIHTAQHAIMKRPV